MSVILNPKKPFLATDLGMILAITGWILFFVTAVYLFYVDNKHTTYMFSREADYYAEVLKRDLMSARPGQTITIRGHFRQGGIYVNPHLYTVPPDPRTPSERQTDPDFIYYQYIARTPQASR